MKISVNRLRQIIDLPQEIRNVRNLLDDVGIEVKRIDGDTLTLEILANRGDHHSYVGIAMEVRGRTGDKMRFPEITHWGDWATHTSRNPATSSCFRYRVIQVSVPAGTDVEGILDDVVLDYGQPVAAYDARYVKLDTMDVRVSVEGETVTLNGQDVSLPVGTMVVISDDVIVSVAGVIVADRARVRADTTDVVLEAACYNPVSIRKASRALRISNYSTTRYERGSDYAMGDRGLGRVLAVTGWPVTASRPAIRTWDVMPPVPHLAFLWSLAVSYLGLDKTQVSEAEVYARLERYGYGFSQANIHIPSWRRWDIHTAEDIYEDLARSYGYDNLPSKLPNILLGSVPSERERIQADVTSVLVGHGMYEVITDGFYGRQDRDRLLCEGDVLWGAHVEVANALDRGYSLLKNNTLIQALNLVATNLAVQKTEIKAYEYTRTFHPSDDGPVERHVLWSIVCGKERKSWGRDGEIDPIYVKGVMEEIARKTNRRLTIAECTSVLLPYLHPTRCGDVMMDEVKVGVMGEIHPDVLARFKIKGARPVYVELDTDLLLRYGQPIPYVDPPSRQLVVKDLTVDVPQGKPLGPVLDVIRANGGIVAADVIDRYERGDVIAWTMRITIDPDYDATALMESLLSTTHVQREAP